MAAGGTGALVRDDGEEIGALDRAEEARFRAAVPVVYDAGVDEGGEEGDAAVQSR